MVRVCVAAALVGLVAGVLSARQQIVDIDEPTATVSSVRTRSLSSPATPSSSADGIEPAATQQLGATSRTGGLDELGCLVFLQEEEVRARDALRTAGATGAGAVLWKTESVERESQFLAAAQRAALRCAPDVDVQLADCREPPCLLTITTSGGDQTHIAECFGLGVQSSQSYRCGDGSSEVLQVLRGPTSDAQPFEPQQLQERSVRREIEMRGRSSCIGL